MSQHPGACKMSLRLSLLLSLLGGSDIDEEGNSQAQGSNCQRGYLKGVLKAHVNVSTTKNGNYMRGRRCLRNLLLWSFCSIHVCQIITLYTLSLHMLYVNISVKLEIEKEKKWEEAQCSTCRHVRIPVCNKSPLPKMSSWFRRTPWHLSDTRSVYIAVFMCGLRLLKSSRVMTPLP